MKSISSYLFRVLSAGLAAIVTLQIAAIFPGSQAGKYLSFVGFSYILSTLFKMGQSYRYLNKKAVDKEELLNPTIFLKTSFILSTVIAVLFSLGFHCFLLLFPDLLNLPSGYTLYLCSAAYLMALIFNNAEYKRITGDAFAYVLISVFFINAFNLLVFCCLYFLYDNLTAKHAMAGYIIALSCALFSSFFILLRNHGIQLNETQRPKVRSLLSDARSGFLFMFYELSEHLQAWSVPIALTMLGQYSKIVEFRIAFRMLSLVSFVPMIINSNFSIVFGEQVKQLRYIELGYSLRSAVKKTAAGIGFAIITVYLAYPVIQYPILNNKYDDLFYILLILSIGYTVSSTFESSTLVLNLLGDKRMFPALFNLVIFALTLFTALTITETQPNSIFFIFSLTLGIKGLLQYAILNIKLKTG